LPLGSWHTMHAYNWNLSMTDSILPHVRLRAMINCLFSKTATLYN
jgi:hypothetical protein